MQDMYRRTLASSWAAQAGELPADECIENIFAGGSGWRDGDDSTGQSSGRAQREDGEDSGSADEMPARRGHRKHKSSLSRASPRLPGHKPPSHTVDGLKDGANDSTGSGSGSQRSHRRKLSHGRRVHHNYVHEVDEFNVREDLRSWRLPTTG